MGHLTGVTLLRLWSCCNLNEIEDEFHFVCKCTAMSDLREDLYRKVQHKTEVFTNLNDQEKFVHLMTHEWKLMSTYIDKAWNVRMNMMYL